MDQPTNQRPVAADFEPTSQQPKLTGQPAKAYSMRYSIAILLVLAALVAAAAITLSDPQECVTDTECMEMHGGNGDPD